MSADSTIFSFGTVAEEIGVGAGGMAGAAAVCADRSVARKGTGWLAAGAGTGVGRVDAKAVVELKGDGVSRRACGAEMGDGAAPVRAVPVLADIPGTPLRTSAISSSRGARRAALINRSKPISRWTRGSGLCRKSLSV